MTSTRSSFSNDDLAAITGSGLFPDLGDEDLSKLISKLQKRTYPVKTFLIEEGRPSEALFIIKEGTVELTKRWNGSAGLQASMVLQDGAVFGEVSIDTGKLPRTSAVATEETEVYLLRCEDFDVLTRDNQAICSALARFTNRIDIGMRKGNGAIALKRVEVQKEVVACVPDQLMLSGKVLPVKMTEGVLMLAMVNTNDLPVIDMVKKYFKDARINPVLVDEDDLSRFMHVVYPKMRPKAKADGGRQTSPSMRDFKLQQELNVHTVSGKKPEGEIVHGETEKEAVSATIIEHANNIVALALTRKASDIHLEPTSSGVRLRLRVDGILRDEQDLAKVLLSPLVNRFKVLSRLDITERRIPQDGRFSLKVQGRNIDFRVSTIPTKYGEKVVIRILDKGAQVFGLDRVISEKATLGLVHKMIKKPYGIIFVTGPTGSGKTTTLYSALSEINTPEVNISTVEDPIEYDLPGINQVEVNPDIGLDFARVLRAFLRQDPDIILVGETRDRETARTAVEAALTGHLVFTTLHTNDAPSTFVRLSEMGIEPFLLSTSIVGIIAQRLMRRVCPDCREPYEADSALAQYLKIKQGMKVYRSKGCGTCNGTGYKGRIGAYEVLTVNDDLKHLIARSANTEEIRARAIHNGMKTLKDYALVLLKEGVTTVDEVVRTVIVEE